MVRKERRGGELARQSFMAMSTGAMGDGPLGLRMWRTLKKDNRSVQEQEVRSDHLYRQHVHLLHYSSYSLLNTGHISAG